MYVTWPWFIALVFFTAAFVFWLAIDNRWGNARTDTLDADLDEHIDAVNKRVERAEDWIRHLDERTRQQAGAMPAEPAWTPPPVVHVAVTDHDPDVGAVPEQVPWEPATEPIPRVPADPPPTVPQEVVLVDKWADGIDPFMARQQQMLDDAMESINAIAEGAA